MGHGIGDVLLHFQQIADVFSAHGIYELIGLPGACEAEL
jgi:hypothetical protein